MLEVAGDRITRLFDRVGEAEAIGQAGQAVPQHFRTQCPFRLDFDGAVDDAEQAADFASLLLRKRSKLDPEEARGNAFAVLEVEFASDVGAVEEGLEKIGDRPGLQAIGLVPVERGAGRLLDHLEEAAVACRHLEALGSAFDDRGRDRQRIEQAKVVHYRKTRSRTSIVRSLPPLTGRQTVDCSLHATAYAARRVNSGCL